MTASHLFAPRYWFIWLMLGILRLIIKLPFKWQFRFGRYLGRIIVLFPSKMRNTTLTNLQLCFPELSAVQRQQLLRKNFESIGIAMIETALGWWIPDAAIKDLAHIHGFEHVKAALQRGKGIILCSAHFTSLELAGRLFAQHLPIAVMYRAQKNLLLNKITSEARAKHYKKIIQREDIRGMLRCLKENNAIWYTADIDAGQVNSVFVPFFGIKAASITATPRYAKISGAAVIPSFFYRREDGKGYDIVFEPALTEFPSDNIEQDVTRINQVIEAAIRKQPDQYIWQYKRFKTRPEGEERFYNKN